jgi:hypothetical protein
MNYFKKTGQLYKNLAVILLNFCVLFILLNAALFAVFKIKDHYIPPIVSLKQLNQLRSLKKVCPELSQDEMKKILCETYGETLTYEPFTQFKRRPHTGEYVNISENGFRNTNNQGPWPPDPDNFNIFLFGGSTSFGYGVSDGQTVASHLQELFSARAPMKNVRIYNFGRPYYYSTQEFILFQRLLFSGFIPDAAIFIDGLNEFYNRDDIPAYTGELKKIFGRERPPAKTLLLKISERLPIGRIINFFNRRIKDFLTKDDLLERRKNESKKDKEDRDKNIESMVIKLIDRYFKNKELIELISGVYGVKTVFIWQPVPTYKYDLKYHLFSHRLKNCLEKYGYPYMAEFIKEKSPGDNFLWCADIQEQEKEPLYVDSCHYSPKMSKKFAQAIHGSLLKRNLLTAKKNK